MARLVVPSLPSITAPIPHIPTWVPQATTGTLAPLSKGMVMPLAVPPSDEDEEYSSVDYQAVPGSEAIDTPPAAAAPVPPPAWNSIMDSPLLEMMQSIARDLSKRALDSLRPLWTSVSESPTVRAALLLGAALVAWNALSSLVNLAAVVAAVVLVGAWVLKK